MFRKASYALRFLIEWIAASHWRSFIIIFFLVFGIRAYELAQFPPKLVLPNTRMELISIARSLYVDGEFADAYLIRTGATAHLPPILPTIIVLTYHIFGFNLTAGYAGFLFIILSTAAIYALLPWLAEMYGFDRQAGVIGALAASVHVVWSGHGEHLAALMLALLLVGMIGRWRKARASFRTSILLGLGWGIAFHIKPALLPIFLGCFGFELWWRKDRWNWTRTGVMVLAVVIACLPWAWRNYVTFGEVFFIRSNLGLELRVGNNDRAEAAMEVMDRRPVFPRHPAVQMDEARLLQNIGEMEYMRRAQREALEWIQEHPTEFLRLTALRFVYYWFGPLFQPVTVAKVAYALLSVAAILGLWRWRRDLDLPQLAAVLIPLATFGLIYYIVTYMPRYRIPIDWIFLILAGAELWYWISRGAQKNESSVMLPDSN
jgi:4-amino-4-deoxy-L-arabinose transferase-like glycosyltransferase